jgi:hypothetical protein
VPPVLSLGCQAGGVGAGVCGCACCFAPLMPGEEVVAVGAGVSGCASCFAPLMPGEEVVAVGAGVVEGVQVLPVSAPSRGCRAEQGGCGWGV